MNARALWGLSLSLVCYAVGQARANPADTFGLGSRSIALGGAVAANVTDTSANYYNPSALSRAVAPSLSLGFVAAEPTLMLDGEQSPVASLGSIVFGLIVPGSVADLPLAFGLSGQLAGNRLSRIVTYTQNDQRWVLFDNRPEQIYLSGNLAVSPTPWLSVGAGYSFLASTSGRLSITGRAVQPGFGSASEFDSELDHEVVADLLSVRYPQFAVSVSALDGLDFALVYRDEGEVALNVDSDIDGTLGIGPLDIPTTYVLNSTTAQSFVPRQLVFGSSFQLSKTAFNIDLTWTQWSRFPSPVSATSSRIELESPPGLLLNVPELPAETSLERANMSDRLSVRVGIEQWFEAHKQVNIPVRVGFAWDPTGANAASNPSLLDADRQLFSIGTGVEWDSPSEIFPGRLRLELHGQWIRLQGREVAALTGAAPLTVSGDVLGAGAELHYSFSD